eukprot:Rhum_TRINITY_DN15441_c3_g2::Rhum_TRINITY_DN15441_c3_g2_i10::g.154925::m.154925
MRRISLSFNTHTLSPPPLSTRVHASDNPRHRRSQPIAAAAAAASANTQPLRRRALRKEAQEGGMVPLLRVHRVVPPLCERRKTLARRRTRGVQRAHVRRRHQLVARRRHEQHRHARRHPPHPLQAVPLQRHEQRLRRAPAPPRRPQRPARTRAQRAPQEAARLRLRGRREAPQRLVDHPLHGVRHQVRHGRERVLEHDARHRHRRPRVGHGRQRHGAAQRRAEHEQARRVHAGGAVLGEEAEGGAGVGAHAVLAGRARRAAAVPPVAQQQHVAAQSLVQPRAQPRPVAHVPGVAVQVQHRARTPPRLRARGAQEEPERSRVRRDRDRHGGPRRVRSPGVCGGVEGCGVEQRCVGRGGVGAVRVAGLVQEVALAPAHEADADGGACGGACSCCQCDPPH